MTLGLNVSFFNASAKLDGMFCNILRFAASYHPVIGNIGIVNLFV